VKLYSLAEVIDTSEERTACVFIYRLVLLFEPEDGDSMFLRNVFWNCKRYEDQRATMMDILSENCKKKYPKSVPELLGLEEKESYKACVTS
jgi:hypothetical protein